jgi:hypothetical protein
MKKTILALALAAGLTSFAGNAKANYAVHIEPKFDISSSYISAWDLTQGSGSFLFGQNFGFLNANQSYDFNIPWLNGAPAPAGWIFAGDVLQGQQEHVMLSSPNQLIGDWSINFNTNYFPELSIYASISGDKTALKNFEYYYKNTLLCPPDFVDKLNLFSSAVDGGTFSVTNQTVPEPSTYALFGIGAIGMLMVLRRRKKTA